MIKKYKQYKIETFIYKNTLSRVFKNIQIISRVIQMGNATLNIRVPTEIAQWLDECVEEQLFNNRSEVVRDLLRKHISDTNNED